MEPLFNPPLHRQRHQFVVDFVKRNKPPKVLDLGCSECSLMKRLKFHREVHLLVGLDIDGTKVKKKMRALAPVSTDYLQPSYDQLCVELYEGSVTERDARLRGFDLVTSIELIEHLTLADVERFSEVVFGYMTPAAVIVSTPNCEYNPLLPGLRGFRHSDHKFEWSRAEFKSWALKACSEFGYEVEFTGVGQPASGYQESVGFCSQIGVFRRLERGDDSNTLGGDDAEDVFSYKLLYSINYPSLCDNNILRRVLGSEVLYWAEKLKSRWMEKKSGEVNASCAPIETEEEGEEKHTACREEMRNVVSQCESGASEDQEEEDEGVRWTRFQRRQDSCTSLRCVSVPLDVLWSCCPRVSTLSGSLGNLRRLLMDDPDVELSQDGDAVLVNCHEQDLEEEEAQDELEDSGYEPASRHHSAAAEQEEDWEASV
ncbi:small RNA 2'-O-methyltransferase isoform X1 [Hippoglossus stenolepis]|uniref:small RNA 2'-O-methyltransferase isoform X1 n=1 Tax=Hippoglossus stenolepis TaxID=195615 RepID=UPI00159C932C|nr:small RNA 2'-O-methyltransferase isoform X1 [Hippoglossus stenolepis]